MLRNLRTQLFAHLRRGAKRSSESAFSLCTGTTRCCSSHGQPTQLLESEFSLGQSLDLQLRSPTSVRIMHGSPYLLHAEWMGSGSEDRFETIQAGQTLTVQEQGESASAAEILAHLPERYCGLRVCSQGGNISIPGTSEAWLDASTTSSGRISIGKCKGHSVSVATQAGDISGSITALDVMVKTESGSVDLKRVAGGRARVTMSNGGCNSRMHIGVLQCGSAEIDSGGSDIHIKQIATAPDSKDPDSWRGEGMQVRSGTGNIFVSGVDGPARLESSNSETNLQVLRNTDFEAVNLGGVINVQLEPAKQYKIHARTSQCVRFGEGCVSATGEALDVAQEFHGWITCAAEGQEATDAAANRCMSSESPQHTLMFTADRVTIERKSWRTSLHERLMKKLAPTLA